MSFNPLSKVSTLVEFLPYIRDLSGKTIVIKYGGHALIDDELIQATIQDILFLKQVGVQVVVVHGGGPAITGMLQQLGIQSRFVQGLRITDDAAMAVTQMVLMGQINKQIVSLFNQSGPNALGICGLDANCFQAEKMVIDTPQGPVDPGRVGEIKTVNGTVIRMIIQQGFIPVLAPIGFGPDGKSLNINADHVAGAVASALHAERLLLLTDVNGVLDKKTEQPIPQINIRQARQFITDGVVSGGMIPKLTCCIHALQHGVGSAHIINGRVFHSLLLELFTDERIGTMIESAQPKEVVA